MTEETGVRIPYASGAAFHEINQGDKQGMSVKFQSMERSIVDSIIGHTITTMRVMSFYINSGSVCDIVALFIRIDTGKWYKLIVSDGKCSITAVNEEPEEVRLDEIADEFAYPVKSFASIYVTRKICGIKQYSWRDEGNELNGFYIELDQGGGFSIFDKNDCLNIFDGVREDKNYSLIPYSH